MTCPICTADNEDILLQTPNLRVIAVHNEAGAPAFCRVIWNNHVSEMTDLSPAERNEIMEMVYQVEAKSSARPKSIWPASAMLCHTCIGTSSPVLKTTPISPRRFGLRPSANTVWPCPKTGRNKSKT